MNLWTWSIKNILVDSIPLYHCLEMVMLLGEDDKYSIRDSQPWEVSKLILNLSPDNIDHQGKAIIKLFIKNPFSRSFSVKTVTVVDTIGNNHLVYTQQQGNKISHFLLGIVIIILYYRCHIFSIIIYIGVNTPHHRVIIFISIIMLTIVVFLSSSSPHWIIIEILFHCSLRDHFAIQIIPTLDFCDDS